MSLTLYLPSDGCVLSKRKKTRKKARFTILSPVRLPFRHTGCSYGHAPDFRRPKHSAQGADEWSSRTCPRFSDPNQQAE